MRSNYKSHGVMAAVAFLSFGVEESREYLLLFYDVAYGRLF